MPAIDELKERLNKLQGMKEALEKEVSTLRKREKTLAQTIIVKEKTFKVLSELSNELIKKTVEKIEKVVTWGLRTVVEDKKLGVRLEFVEDRKSLGLEVVTYNEEEGVEGDVVDTFGGGIAQIESFLFRLIMLVRLGVKRILILDESFACVSDEYQITLSKLLSEVSRKLGVDMLLVTHKEGVMEYANSVYLASSDVDKDGKKMLKLEKVK